MITVLGTVRRRAADGNHPGVRGDKYRVPRMVFVNKMDRTGANFYRCLDMLKSAW